MAWTTSDRRSRLPRDWPRIRTQVLRRDGYRCQAPHEDGRPGKCLAPANQVDHISPGDDHALTNLQALCQWHHARKSSREGAAARKAHGAYRSARRPPESHPLAAAIAARADETQD